MIKLNKTKNNEVDGTLAELLKQCIWLVFFVYFATNAVIFA